MSRWNLIWLLGILGTYLVGFSLSFSAPQRDSKNRHENVRLIIDVLDEVDKKYVKDLDDDQSRELGDKIDNFLFAQTGFDRDLERVVAGKLFHSALGNGIGDEDLG